MNQVRKKRKRKIPVNFLLDINLTSHEVKVLRSLEDVKKCSHKQVMNIKSIFTCLSLFRPHPMSICISISLCRFFPSSLDVTWFLEFPLLMSFHCHFVKITCNVQVDLFFLSSSFLINSLRSGWMVTLQVFFFFFFTLRKSLYPVQWHFFLLHVCVCDATQCTESNRERVSWKEEDSERRVKFSCE